MDVDAPPGFGAPRDSNQPPHSLGLTVWFESFDCTLSVVGLVNLYSAINLFS